jgi:hypothetical protein
VVPSTPSGFVSQTRITYRCVRASGDCMGTCWDGSTVLAEGSPFTISSSTADGTPLYQQTPSGDYSYCFGVSGICRRSCHTVGPSIFLRDSDAGRNPFMKAYSIRHRSERLMTNRKYKRVPDRNTDRKLHNQPRRVASLVAVHSGLFDLTAFSHPLNVIVSEPTSSSTSC